MALARARSFPSQASVPKVHRRFAAAVAALTVLAACDAEPQHLDSLLDPPPPGQGAQFRMTTVIGAGVEAEHCQFMRAPSETMHIYRDEVRFTAGSHHVLLYETDYTSIPTQKEDGERVDTSRVFDCTSGATNGWNVKRLLGGSQNADGDSLLSFPEGVAMEVRADAVLLLNVHYVNASPDELEPEVAVNLYARPAADVHTEGDLLFLYNPLIAVPALGSSRARMRCPVHADITIRNVQSHMHKRGVDYFASVLGKNPFYENDRWQGVPVERFEPGLTVQRGAFLDYACDYQNAEPRDVFQGPRSTDEMCMLIGSYYPADPRTANCLDEKGENTAADWIGNGEATCAETIGCIQAAFDEGGDLAALTECMMAADANVSKESSALLRCIFANDDPLAACTAEIGACAAK